MARVFESVLSVYSRQQPIRKADRHTEFDSSLIVQSPTDSHDVKHESENICTGNHYNDQKALSIMAE